MTAGGVTLDVTIETVRVTVATDVTAAGVMVVVVVALEGAGVVLTQEDGARVCEV